MGKVKKKRQLLIFLYVDSIFHDSNKYVFSGIRYALKYAKRQEELRQKATDKADVGPTLLGEIVGAFNPINSVMWWFNKMNENKRRSWKDEARNKQSNQRFTRRHSRPRHRRVTLYNESVDDWRPSNFPKNMKNHRLTGTN